jgi:hypothetical protein
MNKIRRCLFAFLFAVILPSYANDQSEPSNQYDSVEPAVAIERARQGDPDDLLRLTRMVAKQPHLYPVNQLEPYHQYLQDTNVFLQCFAVQVLAGKKDKSSAEPLRQFILNAERRWAEMEAVGDELDELGQKGAIALTMASETALHVLGGIDEGSSLSLKFLAFRLKHDIPMEWGGGVAHNALARKGRAGLRVLMQEAARPMSEEQERYLEDAISTISDPSLAVDLFVFCKDTKYSANARHSALMVLRDMAKESLEIEQMVICIAEDENSDLRSGAIIFLGDIGTDRSRNKLLELEKTLPQEAQAVQEGLLVCDATNRLPAVVDAFLSPDTPVKEKERLWNLMERSGGAAIIPYAERLLAVSNANGVPLNDLRIRIWKRLRKEAKLCYPLELDPSNKKAFDRTVGEILWSFEDELYRKDAGKWKYTDEQRRLMAVDKVKNIIKEWNGREAEGKQ